jgi:D-xylose transport system permease protein
MSEIINTPAVGSSAVEDPNAAAVEAPAYRQRRSFGQLFRGDLGFLPVLLTLIIIIVFFQIITNGLFFNLGNLTNLFLQNAQIGLCGLGVILVLLLGEIDLSVAAVSTFCGVIMGVL